MKKAQVRRHIILGTTKLATDGELSSSSGSPGTITTVGATPDGEGTGRTTAGAAQGNEEDARTRLTLHKGGLKAYKYK